MLIAKTFADVKKPLENIERILFLSLKTPSKSTDCGSNALPRRLLWLASH